MGGQGVAMIAYGEKAEREAGYCLESLRLRHGWPVCLWRGALPGAPNTDKGRSRHAKTHMLDWTPWDRTLYLDADTRVQGDLSAGFFILDAGWDLAICPSANQGDDWLWHVGEAERVATRCELGGEPLQLQAGAFFVARNERTRELWRAWAEEWAIFQDEDQGAFLRALARHPVRIWLLGYPWNSPGGQLVNHQHGRVR
jgi:hypothetical protein